MRRLILLSILLLVLAATYVAMPFVSAWKIREAIRHGDAAYLTDKIEWASLKETLKPSLSRIALDMPLDPTVVPEKKPSLWQRIKRGLGRGFVDRAVDGYVTPEGLTQLFSLRKTYREKVASTVDTDAQRPLSERVQRFWSRVKRAEFTSPTRFELDVVDKSEPTRLFAGVLELRGIDWKLTELRIADSGHASDPADAGANTAPAQAPARPLAAAKEESSPLER